MKKFLNIEPGGGVPLDNELLFLLQDQPFQTVQAFLNAVGSTWFVDGCEISGVNLVAKSCTLNTGFVYINGELRQVDTTTSTYPFYVVAAPDMYETADFANGAQQNYLVIKRAATTKVLPTNASFLIVDPSITSGDDTVNKRVRPLLNGDLTAALNKEIADRTAADSALRQGIVDEVTARKDADTQLQSNINALSAKVDTKQNRVTTKLAWKDIVISNSYYTTSDNPNDPNANYSGYPYNKFQIMRDEDGFVHLRGYVKGNGGGTIATLSPEYCPKAVVSFQYSYVAVGDGTYGSGKRIPYTHTMTIDPYGNVYNAVSVTEPLAPTDPTGQKLINLHPWFITDGTNYSIE